MIRFVKQSSTSGKKKRTSVEPSAALGVAGAIQYPLTADDRPLTVLSGSNVDFMMLPKIARRGQVKRPETRYYAFEINEQHGAMAELLDRFFANMNIIDFQYGKSLRNQRLPGDRNRSPPQRDQVTRSIPG